MKIRLLFLISILSILTCISCNSLEPEQELSINLIPQPVKVERHDGSFEINKDTRIIVPADNKLLAESAELIAGFFLEKADLNLDVTTEANFTENVIFLGLDENLANLTPEGYTLGVDQLAINLSSSSPTGIVRGFQTLRQLLPEGIEKGGNLKDKRILLPAVEIIDQPAFIWRGMLLDCGRHFMSVDFVKRYIDLLAYHKMNVLHWHLTEDQGWRIEIKKYPKLTEVGAWRTYEDGTRYGGFYTQEQIKEVVEYARVRHITIVPEIEMPGHSVAALAAYPNLSCTGGPFEVETAWGVHKDVYCAGKEETFEFLEDVLTEVFELFPSEYIHIGGDECPKVRWEECPHCQARIKAEGLKDEHELQSYFIKRMEKFINSKGKQIIGWDEILEGGLAPGATVQSWRGMEGAVAAARSGHDTIASPTSHAYFDYSLEKIDLERVYSFDPVPAELTDEERKHVLGGECNMWSERAPEELVDSKVFPRILAMSEILWAYPSTRDYKEFQNRVQIHYTRLDNLGVEYGPESKPVSINVTSNPEEGRYTVELTPGQPGLKIYYSLDGSEATNNSALYEKTFEVKSTTTINAQAYRNGKIYGKPVNLEIVTHKGIAKKVSYKNKYNRHYPAAAELALVDGFKGDREKHNDGYWQAWAVDDMDVTIDLEEIKEISSISTDFLSKPHSWIHLPASVTFYLSDDGQSFRKVGVSTYDGIIKADVTEAHKFLIDTLIEKARYIRVVADNIGVNPPGHTAGGEDAWIFCDEIIIK